jgi:hypothetical protein
MRLREEEECQKEECQQLKKQEFFFIVCVEISREDTIGSNVGQINLAIVVSNVVVFTGKNKTAT